MGSSLFLFLLFLSLALFFWWAFKTLPQEQWQIFATLPIQKGEGAKWTGLNLTYYGVLTACSVTFSVFIFAMLLASNGLSIIAIFEFSIILLGLVIPSAKIIARLIEKKTSTFTIGGASFIGIVTAPIVILFLHFIHPESWSLISMTPALAALWVAYALGEGLGRLGCISFGCCYGKPLSHCHPVYQRIFRQLHFTFSGTTKKVVYEGGLESVPLIPIQGLTALLNVGTGLVGISLFLSGSYQITIWVVAVITQLWRVASEEMRADYRGGKKISMYQWMAALGAFYSILFATFWPEAPFSPPQISQGLLTIWTPPSILFLQALWLAIFLFTGRSQVTGATVSFHVQHEKI